ncbi:MAG: adenosine deaminase [Anaerolineae bacterium]|nr:adenosine deaminase [Anaerolineae bacterium]
MSIESIIRAMPKVELHVHLEGAVRPATLLQLAKRHNIELPADNVEGIQQWYTFRDFPHFVEIYIKISDCLKTVDDIELIAREFLAGQAEQNIVYSEVTYTAWTHYIRKGMAFEDQMAAINRARAWAEAELGVTMNLIIDIPRIMPADEALLVADWAISAHGNGVVALGLGGPEVDNPASRYKESFDRAWAVGLPCILHAGETVGPESIWDALESGRTLRIGHGVRCLEDPKLVDYLREKQIPLEVNPTSNICLGVFPSIEEHPLPKLIAEGLYVTLNSDDPPMFNTTLTDEYLTAARVFEMDVKALQGLVLNAVRVSLLPADQRAKMEADFKSAFDKLNAGLN